MKWYYVMFGVVELVFVVYGMYVFYKVSDTADAGKAAIKKFEEKGLLGSLL